MIAGTSNRYFKITKPTEVGVLFVTRAWMTLVLEILCHTFLFLLSLSVLNMHNMSQHRVLCTSTLNQIQHPCCSATCLAHACIDCTTSLSKTINNSRRISAATSRFSFPVSTSLLPAITYLQRRQQMSISFIHSYSYFIHTHKTLIHLHLVAAVAHALGSDVSIIPMVYHVSMLFSLHFYLSIYQCVSAVVCRRLCISLICSALSFAFYLNTHLSICRSVPSAHLRLLSILISFSTQHVSAHELPKNKFILSK